MGDMEEGRDNHRQGKGIHKKQKNSLKMKEVINKIQVVTQKNTRKNTQIMEVTHKGTAMVPQSLEIQAKSYKIIQVVCAQLVYLVFLSPVSAAQSGWYSGESCKLHTMWPK